MSSRSQTLTRLFLPEISKRGLAALAVAAACLAFLYLKFQSFEHVFTFFNNRRSVIYPSAFTFLSILWGASLTIWGLLKSRATRYIERLSDNVVYQGFLLQLERRLIYGLIVIAFSFAIYVVDLTFGKSFDVHAGLLAVWMLSYLASIVVIFDSVITARVVLG
jgi:hypothetical protein